MKTHFLPAEKDTMEKVFEQHSRVLSEINKTFFLDSVPVLYIILNNKRQIVWANKAVLDLSGYSDLKQILGIRVGELLDCVHVNETEEGCGTTEFCTTCGAVISINLGLKGKIEYQECRIEKENSSDDLDLKVSSTPFEIDAEKFVLFTIIDIQNENRRKSLENIFFHDILNTVGNINGFLKILDPSNSDEFNSDLQILISLSEDLLEEINAQKMLINAENNELTVNKTNINSKKIISDKVNKFRKHHLANDKSVIMSLDTKDIDFQTDLNLLKRILGNMLKNAIGASNPGGKIEVGSNYNGENIEFWVHNETYIPKEIRLQLFHRSFSTKGPGRGLGTYSMKLLTERYFGGKISFTSSETEGTVFKISIPVK